MRKIKFTQQTIDEKFGAMLQDFPRYISLLSIIN